MRIRTGARVRAPRRSRKIPAFLNTAFPRRHAFHASTPCLSSATCSSLAMNAPAAEPDLSCAGSRRPATRHALPGSPEIVGRPQLEVGDARYCFPLIDAPCKIASQAAVAGRNSVYVRADLPSAVSDEFRAYRDQLRRDLTRHNVEVKLQETSRITAASRSKSWIPTSQPAMPSCISSAT